MAPALAPRRAALQTPPMALDTRDVVLSFYRVRQALGWLGLMMPVVLIGGTLALGLPLPPSLSDFYYTPLRDVFVGILFALGVFLLTYLGHRQPTKLVSDRNVSTLAGLGAIGVALFPNDTLDACGGVRIPSLDVAGTLHFVSAGLFLTTTAVFCLVLFRRSDGATPSPLKRRRNRIYLLCGLAIVAALALLGAYFALIDPERRCEIRALRPVLWLEVVTVLAFGLSWLVKGRGIRPLNEGRPPAAALVEGGEDRG